ncbi:MAG: spermidine/putrescine ABC transporter substrate-binding protein [Oscillospiraceae bacterium]|jgi:spermidine/putrescine-binding protein|nr:spermidine/putrescine ABC transporter substrate-binding protein [Oscillospiraceae bacterium]
MKKILALTLAVLLLAASLAGCAKDGAADPGTSPTDAGANTDTPKLLTIYSWEGMFPQEVLDDFEAETGVRVNYVSFDTDETMLTKLEEAGGGDYDLVIADDYIIESAIAEGLVQKLDKSKLPSLGNVNPVYQGQFYDPADEYTVPYGAGVQTIVYDPSRVSVGITGYADLLDPSLRDSVGIIANYRVINGIGLKILGKSYNTNDLSDIRAAGDTLRDLAPNIRVIKDDSLEQDLLTGEISAAVMYTSQVTMAKLENPNLEVVYPSEGIGFGIMAGFIPSNAPNADGAHAFLEFILDPARGAACFEWLGYYSTYTASDPLIAEEYREFLTLPAGFASGELIGNISDEANELHEQIWTEFKDATGK